MGPMRYLIDGNNLLHALADVGIDAGRQGLCALLGGLAEARGDEVAVIFDGTGPRGPRQRQIRDERITVRFSGTRPADDVIAEIVQGDSAPRRLTVVSGDRQVQRNARKRRCGISSSRDFANMLKLAQSAPKQTEPAEPSEKQHGPGADQVDHWLEVFGLEDAGQGREDGSEP